MGSPNLDEITTTTARNRKMAKGSSANAKAGLKVAQTGTPVPDKDFSPKAKETKAAGTGKPEKGSAATAKALPTESATSTPVEKKTWEGSSEDWSADYSAAKRRGKTTADYEDSAHDRVADAAGERRMAADESNESGVRGSSYKRGTPATSNSPKSAHGFGHPSSAREGHLRNSGHSSAHRIGKK